MIRRLLPILAFCLPLSSAFAQMETGDPMVVPIPESVQREWAEFKFMPSTQIVVARGNEAAFRAARILRDLIMKSHRMYLVIREGSAQDDAINLRAYDELGRSPEAYRVDVRRARVTLTASTLGGFNHAVTTLWQMMPRGMARISGIHIDDAPRFPWRGVMLDSARHYQSPDFIKRFIDAMSLNKLNVLHWHLTDDQAWRVQIRKYPALTDVGAYRVPAGALARKDIDPATGKPRLYGGFYETETIRSIVSYAQDRGITIVPEIEMPGHAAALVAAYPALGAGAQPGAVPSDWGHYAHVLNLDESTFTFVEDVLTEVMDLFPGKYIHVGGDEVETTQWRDSAKVQARMRELSIADTSRIQPYFTQRIARFLESKGRRLVGWDEIVEPGLPRSAVVMSWRGVDGALAAASKGYDTVIAAQPTLYFDNRQSASPSEPPGRGRVVSLEDVYRFEPMPASIKPEQQKHVLGIQANVWTEHIRTEERVGWMTFPRAAAVAEHGWSQPERRDWAGFQRRLEATQAKYDALGIPYAKPAPVEVATPGAARKSQQLTLCSDNIALSLEDDAPREGPRAAFLVDIQNPCWIYRDANLDSAGGIIARVGQVPFNFQIGEDVKKIRFPQATTAQGELEVRLDKCDGELLARLPLAPAVAFDGVTALARAPIPSRPGRHDLCLRFAQPVLDPLWVIDSIQLDAGAS
jgi:hexosaminidase